VPALTNGLFQAGGPGCW